MILSNQKTWKERLSFFTAGLIGVAGVATMLSIAAFISKMIYKSTPELLPVALLIISAAIIGSTAVLGLLREYIEAEIF